MRFAQPLSLLLLPLCLALSACPGDNNNPPGGDAGPDDTGAKLAQDLCVAYTIGENNYIISTFHSFGACSVDDPFLLATDDVIADIAEGCVSGNMFYDLFLVAIEGGRVDVDAGKVASCLAKARTARATTSVYEYNTTGGDLLPLFSDADCTGAIKPLQGDGDACVQGWDCQDGLVCQADPPTSGELRCLAPAGEGAVCGGTRVCDVDLTCVNEVCEPAIELNGTCDPSGAGAPCVEGTFCSEAGVCTTLGTLDDPCTWDGECAEGFACDAASATCQVVTQVEPVADGQVCDPASTTQGCANYCFVCRADEAGGATRCLARNAAGGYCEDQDHCLPGFFCDTVTSACVAEPEPEPAPKLGESCVVDGPACEEGSCVEGTCVAGVEGDRCDPELGCQVGLVCKPDAMNEAVGDCVRAPVEGERCIEDQCEGGHFCDPQNVCQRLRTAGATCSVDDECESGECLNAGQCAAAGPSCYSDRGWFVQFLVLGLILPALRLRRRRS